MHIIASDSFYSLYVLHFQSQWLSGGSENTKLFLHCLGVVIPLKLDMKEHWQNWPWKVAFCWVWRAWQLAATGTSLPGSRPSNPNSDHEVAHSPSAVDKDGCHLAVESHGDHGARFYEPFAYMAFVHMCKQCWYTCVLAHVCVGCFPKSGHQSVLEHAYLIPGVKLTVWRRTLQAPPLEQLPHYVY